ncbi:hypothetical protein [Cypionkella sp.]|uniref:hypothetical protein n=1 Tax=Cypionkella sp. TaxID=2811411 RepID=UPI00351CEE37
MPAAEPALKIGIHGSLLALSQAYGVRRNLMAAFDLPLEAFEGGVIKVTSEVMHDRALKEIGGKGLFIREIEEALDAGGNPHGVVSNSRSRYDTNGPFN